MAAVSGTKTIDTDEFTGLTYTALDTHVTVEKNVLVVGDPDGVRSTHAMSTLINKGIVFGQGNDFSRAGVRFEADDSVITNAAGALIKGYLGIIVNGDGATITNHGSVLAYGSQGAGIRFDDDSNNVMLDNRGEILSPTWGIYVNSQVDGGVIKNAGLISGKDQAGVYVIAGAGVKAKIVNTKDGTIRSDKAAIATEATQGGRIALDNKGKIDGKIDLAAASGNVNDKVVNKAGGVIKGSVELGPGNDTFVFAGGKQGTVFGEAGADRFDFKTKLVTGKDAAKIGDMTPGTDTIGVSKKLFGDIGPKGDTLKKKYFEVGKKANDKDDRFIYNPDNGKLFYDKDGKGGAGQKLIAKLDDGLNLKASDFLVIA